MKTVVQMEADDVTEIMPDTCDVLAKTKAGKDALGHPEYTWTADSEDNPCRLEVLTTEEERREFTIDKEVVDGEWRLYLEPGVSVTERNRIRIDSTDSVSYTHLTLPTILLV